MTTLYINPNNSVCGACNRGTSPLADKHDTIMAYSPDTGSPGCGAEFTHVSSHYFDFNGLYERIEAIRPDLISNFIRSPRS